MFGQLEADQVGAAIAPCSCARSGEYNVKEIKRPSFVYNVYLFETRREGMRHTIPHQRLGFPACDIIIVNNIKEPVENSSVRLECGNRSCGQYNNELSHGVAWGPNS